MSSAVASKQPATIACYPISGCIREGGQGTVYAAREPHTGAAVAIKVLSEQMTHDEVSRLRFAQECQIARRLQHPNIVRVLDFGLDGEKPYLVMEYVNGESLGDRIEREVCLSEREAVAIIAQIGQALSWAHQRGLIHRDVKPDNILIGTDGVTKLTDLGLVKNLDGDFNLTQTQSGLGTPNFTPPEQFDDAKRADAQSDLYALAATLYMAITGELPFRTRSAYALGLIYKKKLANDIAPPRQLVPEVSERVSAAICKGLRAERSERQANVQEFIAELGARARSRAVRIKPAVAAGVKPAETKETPPSERRRPTRFPAQVGMCCQPLERAASDWWDGVAVNVSEHGFCMELMRAFQPGTNLLVRVGNKKINRQSLLARVMWVKKHSACMWQIGCQYDQPLTEQEVSAFC